MTCIIAIETATEACSAALLVEKENQPLVYKRYQLAPREHTKLILPMLDEVLAEAKLQIADVDAIAFGRGPGAFTGLRIATGIAQGIAMSVDKLTIPVSSLMAMALHAHKESNHSNDSNLRIVAAIDARMGEVYWAEYSIEQGVLNMMGEEQLSSPSNMYEKTQALLENQQIVVIGSGWDEYLSEFIETYSSKESLQHLPSKYPDAEEISELALLAFKKGELNSIEEAQPVYLRNNVAEKSKKSL